MQLVYESDCRWILRLLDSYVSNELAVETAAQVLRHLERCPHCLQVAEIRLRVKTLLQRAGSSEHAPMQLKKRVTRMLRRAAGA